MTESLFPLVDDDLVRALAWCRLGGAKFGRPESDASFRRAKEIGLLAQDPVWRATPQGEGVLIALGLLGPTWIADRTRVVVLWGQKSGERENPQFIASWPSAFAEHFCESFIEGRAQAEEDWLSWLGEPNGNWSFFLTDEELGRPALPVLPVAGETAT